MASSTKSSILCSKTSSLKLFNASAHSMPARISYSSYVFFIFYRFHVMVTPGHNTIDKQRFCKSKYELKEIKLATKN